MATEAAARGEAQQFQRQVAQVAALDRLFDRMNFVEETLKALTAEIYTFYSKPANRVCTPSAGDNDTSRANMRRVIEDATRLFFISGPPNTTDRKVGYLFPLWIEVASQDNKNRATCLELMEDYLNKISFVRMRVGQYHYRIDNPTIPAPAAPGENTGSEVCGGRRKTKKVKTNRRYTRKR
jgi:hypothetical protein